MSTSKEDKICDTLKILLDLVKEDTSDEIVFKMLYFLKDLTPSEIIELREICIGVACYLKKEDNEKESENARILFWLLAELIYHNSKMKDKYRELFMKFKADTE